MKNVKLTYCRITDDGKETRILASRQEAHVQHKRHGHVR